MDLDEMVKIFNGDRDDEKKSKPSPLRVVQLIQQRFNVNGARASDGFWRMVFTGQFTNYKFDRKQLRFIKKMTQPPLRELYERLDLRITKIIE